MRTRGQVIRGRTRGAALRDRKVGTASQVAPILGLNARDSIANMKPGYAIKLDNWVPQTTSVQLRNGYATWQTGYTAAIETLMNYKTAAGSKMFSASGTAFYDASSSGVRGSAVVSGLSSARWQYTNFGTPGGQFLYAVDGVSYAQMYDGTSWHQVNLTSTPYAITGIDSSLLKDVQVYAQRLWFIERQSFRVWYLPVQAIAGAASSIDLSSLFRLGGSLTGMIVWTVAGELGTTNYAAFISSEGEGLVYAGINPDDADGFTLQGTFRIGKPIGQRFWARVGADTLLLTQDGVIPLSKAVSNNRANQSDAVSFTIQQLLNDDTTTYGSQFGWQVMLSPLDNKIFVNSPRPASVDTVQYVMNTITNAWCRYTGLPAQCFELHDDKVFFGDDTAIYQAEVGADDAGKAIVGDLMPAYSYFKSEGQQKYFTNVRPVLTVNGPFQPSLSLALDFQNVAPSSQPQLTMGTPNAEWDTSPWNVTPWGDTPLTVTSWQSVGGLGFAASLRIQSATRGITANLQALDYAYEIAGGLY